MKTKHVLSLLLLILLVACEGDYNTTTTGYIHNNSSYNIEIELDINTSPHETIQIKKGEIYSVKKSTVTGYWGPEVIMPPICIIKFGEQVSTLHRNLDGDQYHNFCSPNAYTRQVNKKKRTEIVTFTFTDADYEYARDHPVPENPLAYHQ